MISNALKTTPYILRDPTERQRRFMANLALEAFYRAPVAGGKTEVLLMTALQWVDHPMYRGLLIHSRDLVERASYWLLSSDAIWHPTAKLWEFPSGAQLAIQFMDDVLRHINETPVLYQFIGIDGVGYTNFIDYSLMFCLLGNSEYGDIPLRIRSTFTPSYDQKAWVRARYQSLIRK